MGDVSALKGSGDMYGAKMSLNKFVGKWRMSLYGDLGKSHFQHTCLCKP